MSGAEVAFLETLERERLLRKGERVVIGVSGGGDSVCLLRLFHGIRRSWDLVLTTAHFNHGLRGDDSEKDQRFVEELSASLKIPCRVGRSRLQAEDRKDSIELSARQERYQFFQKVCAEGGISILALAHTRDDDAETILFRILRGNNGKGLTGIAYRRKLGSIDVIRPLKEVSRQETRQFLVDHGLSWREDRTNADLHFTRNRIRRELLPYLKERFNPSIEEALLRLGRERSQLEAYLSSEVDRLARRYVHHQHSGVLLEGRPLLKLHPFLQKELFWRSLEALGLGGGAFRSSHAQTALSLLHQGKGSADLPKSVHLKVDQEGLHMVRKVNR